MHQLALFLRIPAILVLLNAGISYAQPGAPGTIPQQRQSGPQAKTTALAYRVVARASIFGAASADTFRIGDSSTYQYSGNRGTRYDDTSVYYGWTSTGQRVPRLRAISGYDLTNHRTLYITQNWVTNSWVSDRRETRYPDATGIDTLIMTDTFSKTLGIFGPYSRYRVQYYDSTARNYLFHESGLWNKATSTYDLIARTTYYYDAAGNNTGYVQEYQQGGVLTPTQQFHYTFSPTNKELTMRVQNMISGVWETADSIANTYDAADNRVLSVRSTFVNGSVTKRQVSGWEFYANGYPAQRIDSTWSPSSGSWTKGYRLTYTHPNPGVHECVVSSVWTASGWLPADSSSSETDNVLRYSRLQDFTYHPSGWYPLRYMYYKYNSGWTVDSSLVRTRVSPADTLMNVSRQTATYDALNRLVLSESQVWQNGAWTYRGGGQTRFYYESYNDGVGVPQAPALAGAELTLFPVPASERLHVRLQTERALDYQARITDISGRTIAAWSGTANRLMLHTVSVSELSPGIYLFSLNTGSGDLSRTFSVTR